MSETCKTCKWCEKNELKDMICVNDESEYVADFVDEKHYCIDYEPKRRKNLVSQ